MIVDVMTQIGAVNREVSERDHEGKARRVVSASRTFATSPEDLWDAITQPERLARWFGFVSGDLCLGGSFRIKGNANGEVTACNPPQMLAVTWKMYGDIGWVHAHLSPSDGGTLLKVEHILSRRLFDRLYWSWYGAGAAGVGWELWLLALDQSIRSGVPTIDDIERWRLTAEGKDYLKRATQAWGRAEVAHGEREAKAMKKAARACTFYSKLPAH
ncbi:MAG: Aha1 domain protein [Polyangiaceae bacterium]|nr:Aha1 domain protein [Polyangiaceae bacterium]